MKKINKPYYRPNQKWVCGRAREGKACAQGPSPSGHCHVKWECTPAKKGNGFACARPPQFGGPCNDGPLSNGECSSKIPPCTPERSIRSMRGIYTLTFASICLAAVLFLFGLPQSHQFVVSAGPLSSKHKTMKNNCMACHTNAHGDKLADWKKQPNSKIDNSKACVSCHKVVDHPFNPHNLSPEKLRQLTMAKAPEGHNYESKEWGCTTCHKEHKGDQEHLLKMSDKDCQSCHAEQFESFEKGHPEFSNYPFIRSQKISFDHSAHLLKYFPDKSKNASCIDCHSIELTGQAKMQKDFKNQCMSCHGKQIVGELSPQVGIEFINLPGIDLDVLKKRGAKVGDWPEEAHGEMSNFTKLLVASDKELSKHYKKIKHLDLTDLDEANKSQIKAVESFVWEFKSMLLDILEEESGEFQRRFGLIFNKEFDPQQTARLLSGFPVDVLRKAIREWIPSIRIEVEMYKKGHMYPSRSINLGDDFNDDEGWMSLGGWYRMDEEFAIKYRSRGHEDDFIRSWVDLSGSRYTHSEASKGIFDQLSNHKSAGNCTQCHTVAHDQFKNLEVNWMANKVRANKKSLVKFSHKTHIELLDEKGCVKCHKLQDHSAYMPVDHITESPDRVKGNFSNITKATCLECHSDNKVKNACMTCHNYHIDSFDRIEKSLKDLKTH